MVFGRGGLGLYAWRPGPHLQPLHSPVGWDVAGGDETRSARRTSKGAAGFAGMLRRFLLEGLMGSVTA
jgi:hypothetical protein